MGSKNYNSWLMVVALGGSLAGAMAAQAQDAGTQRTAADAQAKSLNFSIPAGSSLASALMAFGQQSGLQLIAPSELTAGLSSAGVNGSFQPDDALRELLSGTALAFKYVSANTIQVYGTTTPATEGAEVLGAVQVDGAMDEASSGGIGVNGSRDITATEGSRSLNGGMLTLGSKSATSIKDTPQSVSVMTSEAMQQQNIQNLNDAMKRTTGVTTRQGGDSRSMNFYSRGYQITNMQIDGGSPISIGDSRKNYRFQPSFDMSLYDHVEVLRGADGLFSGNSETGPAGTINLVRKRPLDHFQTVLQSDIGSWNNYRNVVDVTGPLAFDGRVRGRSVLTWNNRDYFYNTAHDDNKIIFGSLEADLTPSTLLNVGASYNRMRGAPWFGGLMMYQDGSDPHLSRKTSYTFPWTKSDTSTTELFASLEQQFGDNWQGKINYTHLKQNSDIVDAEAIGTIPLDGSRVPVNSSAVRSSSEQDSLDATLNGQVDVFDLPQKVTLGGNWQRIKSKITSPGDTDNALLPPEVTMDPFHWDAGYPAPNISDENYANINRDNLTQWGLYSRFEVTPWKPLHFTFGMRLNSYRSNTLQYIPGEDSDGVYRPLPNASNDAERTFEKPYYAVSFDINNSWTWYGSYTDLYSPQLSMIGLNGSPIAPLTGSNYETGLKYARPDGMMNASLALYRIKRTGAAQQVLQYDSQTGELLPTVDLGGGRTGYYVNSSSPEISQGADLEITGQLLPWWQTTLGYTYNTSKQGDTSGNKGTPLQTFIPKHTVKLWNDFQFSDGGDLLSRFQFGLGVQAESASYVLGDYCNDDASQCGKFNFKSGFYATVDARVAYDINKNWNIALRGDNLLDRTYYQTTGDFNGSFWYGQPRNFTLSVTGKFE